MRREGGGIEKRRGREEGRGEKELENEEERKEACLPVNAKPQKCHLCFMVQSCSTPKILIT